MKSKLFLLSLLVWGALAAAGMTLYTGSVFIYLIFSAVFLAIIISGFYRNNSYGYMFLAVMLWLGFWLKFTLHLVIGSNYIEPVGSFTFSPKNLDAVLITSSVAGAGVLLAWITQFAFGFGAWAKKISGGNSFAPYWYAKYRRWLWGIVWLAIIVWPLLNIVYGINQIGMVPRTVLIWPMNAVISWFVTMGVSISVVTLLWWDIGVGAGLSQGFFAVLAEATFSTISLISRGTFILHAVPPIVAALKGFGTFMSRVSRWKLLLACVFFGASFIFSMSMVTALRTHLYGAGPGSKRLIELFRSGSGSGRLTDLLGGGGEFISHIMVLGTDRWIGVEGVMSVHSYPSKGKELFLKALVEKREIGKVTMYQEVCNSHYRWMDSSKWQFAAIPGAAAFFYYSGSMFVVFLGLFILTFAVFISETGLKYFLGNPFLCSLWGLTAANTVAQFGISPRQMFPYFYMIFCALFVIWLVQTRGRVKVESQAIP